MESHLLQMRGLKQNVLKSIVSVIGVASFTDAWIETFAAAKIKAAQLCRIFYRCVD